MDSFLLFNQTEEDIEELESIKVVLNKALEIEDLDNVSFNVIMVDNDYIHNLNREYRNIDRETDVITFALEDEKDMVLPDDTRILGDIYISLDRARSQANDFAHSLKRELSFLAVHGFYHLLGYDHMTKEEEEVMFKKQEEVLDACGIKR